MLLCGVENVVVRELVVSGSGYAAPETKRIGIFEAAKWGIVLYLVGRVGRLTRLFSRYNQSIALLLRLAF